MPVGDALAIGLSGTLTTQRELATTSHNIANANTEGYSRQRVSKSTRNPQQLADGALGRGVQITSVKRNHNDFLTNSVQDNSSLTNFYKTGFQLTSQVNELLSDPKAGVGLVMQDFFDAVNGVANEPSSTTARQVMITQANTLTNRFHDINSRLQDLQLASNKQTRNVVKEINFLARSIAKLNNNITVLQQSTGQPANDLQDQREVLLKQLSEKISIKVMEQDDGAVNVFIGNGQTMVIGIQASKLDVVANEFDVSKIDIAFVGGNSETDVTKFISGGELGGLLEYQHDIINSSKNELGRISLALATTFNAQHESGLDLKSNFGKQFFSGLNESFPEVISGSGNHGDSQLSSKIIDVTKITASDYRLEYNGNEYNLIRLNDNVSIEKFNSFPKNISSEGFSLNIDSGGSMVAGDSFLIRPTHLASKHIKVLISDTNEIAASSAIRAKNAITNLGDAQLELDFIDVTDIKEQQEHSVNYNDDGSIKISQGGEPESSNITFNIDDLEQGSEGLRNITVNILANNELQFVNNSSVDGLQLLSTPIKYTPDEDLVLSPIFNGNKIAVTAKLKGELVAGDSFVIEFNDNAIGDNSNMLALAKLHRANNLIEGRVNYNQAYAELVSRVGTRTHELDVNADAQQVLLNQSIEAKESVSGVNLDEEAANLIRLQTQFKANAQVISSTDQMFKDLMSVFR